MYKPSLVAGVAAAVLAVMLGAFGAHGLRAIVPADQVAIFEKGVTYQFYHSLALICTGIIHTACPARATRMSAAFFVLGILLFSGSLYAMVGLQAAGTGIGAAGIITPIGGLFFIAGWITLLTGILKTK